MNFSLEKMTPMRYNKLTNVIKASVADVKRYSYICIQLINERAMGAVLETAANSIFDCVGNPTARFLFGGTAMSKEIITPVEFPPKPAIYKIESNGSRQYCSESRGQYRSLAVQEDDLLDYLNLIFSHFKELAIMLSDSSWGNPYFILETLIIHFKNHIEALDHFIRQEIGNIQVETIDDEIVGVSVKQIDKNR